MAFPLALALGAGALSLGSKYFAGRSQKKQAEAADREANAAADRKFAAEQAAWDDDERLRGSRLSAANAFLQSLGGQYAVSPELLAALSAPRRYGGSLAPRSTRSAGAGNAFVSGLTGADSDMAMDVGMGAFTQADAGGPNLMRPTQGASSPSVPKLQVPNLGDLNKRRY